MRIQTRCPLYSLCPRRIALPGLVLSLSMALAGCGEPFSFNPLNWFRGPAAIVIPWDSISPPPITAEVELLDPPPIEMGRVPEPGRYDQDLDVVHYDVELVIPPANDRISSRTTIRYVRERAGPHSLTLDFSGLSTELVTAEERVLEFTHEGGLIRFDHPGRPGVFDTLQVEIMARGVPDDGLILRDNVHGAPTAFADNWPNRARYWFPSNDHPSDKATAAFTVHVPAGRRVVANGVQLGAPVPADSQRTGGVEGLLTWRWETRVPIPTYLMVVGVGEMEVTENGLAACERAPASSRGDRCIEVTSWVFPPDTARAREAFSRAAEMVDLYVDLFGPYPFEKLANIQSSTMFGGMENASAIFYSEATIARGANIEGTVAHEIVHQWFGDSVTPAEWQHLWLSEGFASYFGPLFWAQTQSDAAFRERIDALRDRYLASHVIGRPVLDQDVTNLLQRLNENSYEKGALVLHMLRDVVGERAFFDGIRRYYQRFAGGIVTTDDFQMVMEEVHGQSLDWFFQQWLRRPGYPVLRVEWGWDDELNQAQVRVIQEQDELWPTFRMPMEFEFLMEGGVHRVADWVDGREWSRGMSVPARPRELRIDPDGWLLFERVGVTGP